MRRTNLFYAVLALFVVVALSGCATAQKKRQEELQGIKTKVDTIESRLEGIEARQVEAERLSAEQAQMEEMRAEKMASTNISVRHGSAKSKEHTKEIQAALKNAGFYSGIIDGVKGRKTRKAIREFQKANGLISDGVVGKKTWELLCKNMDTSPLPQEVSK